MYTSEAKSRYVYLTIYSIEQKVLPSLPLSQKPIIVWLVGRPLEVGTLRPLLAPRNVQLSVSQVRRRGRRRAVPGQSQPAAQAAHSQPANNGFRAQRKQHARPVNQTNLPVKRTSRQRLSPRGRAGSAPLTGLPRLDTSGHGLRFLFLTDQGEASAIVRFGTEQPPPPPARMKVRGCPRRPRGATDATTRHEPNLLTLR